MFGKRRVISFLPHFVVQMRRQLKDDEKRWGEAWLRYPLRGQTSRIFQRFWDYWMQWHLANQPMPWLKIACYAMIAWIRTTWPDVSPAWEEPDSYEIDLALPPWTE